MRRVTGYDKGTRHKEMLAIGKEVKLPAPAYRQEGGHPAGRQVPLNSVLEGGVKGHNIIRKVPYREATPFRAWNFTCP